MSIEILSDGSPYVAAILGSTDNAYLMQRALTRRGIASIIFSDVPKDTFKGVAFNVCPSPSDPDELISYLNDHRLLQRQGVISVIPSTDEFAQFISVYGGLLDSKYRWLAPPADIARSCANKVHFDQLCKRMGVAAPRAFVFASEEAYEATKNALTFPLIIKPTFARELPKSVIPKVKLLESEAEFYEVARKVWALGADVFCQEYIPGGYECVFFVGGFVNEAHEPEQLFIGHKKMEYPLLGGTTTFCQLEWVDDAYELARRFVKDTGYSGLIDIEFKRDPRDGKLRVIEVNPRIGQWHRVSDDGKMDLISYYAAYLADHADTDDCLGYKPHVEGRTWVYCHYHLIARIEQKGVFIGIVIWLKDVIGAFGRNDWDISNRKRFFRLVRVVIGRMRQLGLRQLILPKKVNR